MKNDGPFEGKNRKKDPRPRPVTESYLMNAASFYLGRYASSAENLKRVLDRKVRRRNEGHSAPDQQQLEWIETTAEKCVRLGLVNDAEYARARAFSMHRSGKSERIIIGTLKQKGVGESEIRAALAELKAEKGEGLELKAAIKYARRRRFGPFRTRIGDDDKKQREMASFARAGFGFSLSRRVVDAAAIEDLDE